MSGKRLSIANANAKKDEKGKRKGEKIPLNECRLKPFSLGRSYYW